MLIILFNSIGCVNNSERINKFADDILDDSIKYYKQTFNENFEKAKLQNHKDPKTIKLKIDIIRFSDFIDNTNNIVKTIKDDGNEIGKIREIFIDKHVGDSIYHTLSEILILADDCVNSPAVKNYISQERALSLGNKNVGAWTNSIFGLNNPTAVTWFLKGIQIEVYKIGATVFLQD